MKNKFHKIIINTDGGARGNPGQAALGVVVQDEKGKVLKRYHERIGIRTNNEAEYEAVIFALKKTRQLFGKDKIKDMQIEFRLDSELVVRQLNNKYKIEEQKLFPLFISIHNLCMDVGRVTFAHIRREKNYAADKLVNEALDEGSQNSLL